MAAFITPVTLSPTTGSWQTVDVSAYVSAAATGVMLHVQNQHASVAYGFGARKNVSTDNRINNITYNSHLWLAMGVKQAGKLIDIYRGNASIVVEITGYFESEAVFFDNAYDVTVGTPGAWTDVSVAGYTTPNTAIGVFLEGVAANNLIGARCNGSTDSDTLTWYAHAFLATGVDASQIFEEYITAGNTVFINGYMKSGATFYVNQPTITTATTGAWTDMAALPGGSIGSIIRENHAAGSSLVGLRQNGSAENIYRRTQGYAGYGMVACDASNIIEYEKSVSSVFFRTVAVLQASAGVSVSPAKATITYAGKQPTITAYSAGNITPGSATITYQGFAPLLNQRVSPASATITYQGKAPTISTSTKAATFPRLGCMVMGNAGYDTVAMQQAIGRTHVAILGFWKGWGRNGWTMNSVVQAIRGYAAGYGHSIMVGKYTIITETTNNGGDAATADLYNKCQAMNWWARTSWPGDYPGTVNVVSEYSGTFQINFTAGSTADGNGQRYPQWYGDWCKVWYFDIVSPAYDIWYVDNWWEVMRRDADWNQDGAVELTSNAASQVAYRQGEMALHTKIKALYPNIKVMGNADNNLSSATYVGQLDGSFMEASFIIGNSGWTGYSGDWNGTMTRYRAHMANTKSPHIVLVAARGTASSPMTANEHQFVRYTYATVLLDNGYYVFETGAYSSVPVWCSEFDLYLGEAITDPPVAAWSNGVWRRDFQHAIVLVNPQTTSRTVTLPNGVNVTLAVRDGLVYPYEQVVGSNIQPTPGAITYAGAQPVITKAWTRMPLSASLTYAGKAPTIALQSSGSPIVTPDYATITYAGETPSIDPWNASEASVTVGGAAEVAYAGNQPAITFFNQVSAYPSPASAQIAYEGKQPAVVGLILVRTVEPTAGSVAYEGKQPNIDIPVFIDVTPLAGTLAYAGKAPTLLLEGPIITPQPATITYQGQQPEVVSFCVWQPCDTSTTLYATISEPTTGWHTCT